VENAGQGGSIKHPVVLNVSFNCFPPPTPNLSFQDLFWWFIAQILLYNQGASESMLATNQEGRTF